MRTVARFLKENLVRNTDLIARYGGEEFACLLPATDLKGALETAERLCKAVEQLAIPNKGNLPEGIITASFGVAALIPEKDGEPGNLVHVADQAPYRAKDFGRNQVTDTQTIVRKVS